ncbi:MAG: putative nitrogen fixation protein NifT [Cyanothece sp. SIO1E1]|nr:putative nitrogen fixation protein NifT [Cyanothece sp. SIO1E1]
MKVMLRENNVGTLLAYVAKKDLEEEVVYELQSGDSTIFTLANGWELAIAGHRESLQLPQTVEARRLS